MLSAVIWDVDGTIAETERDGHRVAFNRAFVDAGLPWEWDEAGYGELLRITGGRERLLHDLVRRAAASPSIASSIASSTGPSSPAALADLAERLHRAKNVHYADIVETCAIDLRPGVLRLMDACAATGMRNAIATTTSRANVEALLRPVFGVRWWERFDAVVCAEDAPVKKPDPSAYRLALARLALNHDAVLAIEDSRNGLVAAAGAGIATLVTRSHYFREDDFDGAAALCDDLDRRVTWPGAHADRVDPTILRELCASHRAA